MESGDNGGGGAYGDNPDYAGGIVHEFWLQGTDHIILALLEKDGKLTVNYPRLKSGASALVML